MLDFLYIFCLRLLDTSLSTLRFMMTLRGRRWQTWVFAFGGAIAYVVGVRSVLADMSEWTKLLGYAAGFACGMSLGMWLEERIAMGYTRLQIISRGRGAAIIEHLRQAGFAVTEIPARGKDGTVSLLQCSVPRRHVDEFQRLVFEQDSDAFVTAQDVRPLQHGYWPQKE